MTKEEFYSRALSFDEVGEQVDIFKKEKIKYEQEIIDKIFTRITLWKMEDITMETAKVLDDLLSMFKEV